MGAGIAKSDPLVTAVIPTFNRASRVSTAIESVLAQTYQNIEVIVVDDGSVDETRSVVSQYKENVKYVHQDNAGPSAARNRGVAQSSGELVAFLDSDDTWNTEFVRAHVSLHARAPRIACSLSNARITNLAGTAICSSFELAPLPLSSEKASLLLNPIDVLLSRNVLFNQCMMIRRETLIRVGGFDSQLRILEDYDLALRLSTIGHFALSPELLTTYAKDSEGSLTGSASRRLGLIEATMVSILNRFLTSQSQALSLRAKKIIRWRCLLAARTSKAAASSSSARFIWTKYSNEFLRWVIIRLPSYPRPILAAPESLRS